VLKCMPMMFFYFLKIIFDISTSKRSKKYKPHSILAKKKKNSNFHKTQVETHYQTLQALFLVKSLICFPFLLTAMGKNNALFTPQFLVWFSHVVLILIFIFSGFNFFFSLTQQHPTRRLRSVSTVFFFIFPTCFDFFLTCINLLNIK